MLPAADLLELYRAEKEAFDWPCDPFMSFKEWKKEYEIEYKKNHVTVDIRVAMREAEAIVQKAEAELGGFLSTHEEEIMMSENTNVEIGTETNTVVDANLDEQAKRDARNARRREQRQAKKAEAPAKPAKVKAEPKPRTPRSDSKTALARVVFARMHGNSPRKDVIAAFISEVGLTANGASTYYQKLKREV